MTVGTSARSYIKVLCSSVSPSARRIRRAVFDYQETSEVKGIMGVTTFALCAFIRLVNALLASVVTEITGIELFIPVPALGALSPDALVSLKLVNEAFYTTQTSCSRTRTGFALLIT